MSGITSWFRFYWKVAILMSVLGWSFSADTLYPTESVRVGQTLVSAGNAFELGFFSPGNSRKWFLGLWYRVDPGTILWVANREHPLLDSEGSLRFASPGGKGKGNLVIINGSDGIAWSTNLTGVLRNPVMRLLNSGNLVILESTTDASGHDFSWQSFDHPSHTLLPGMKMGWESRNGSQRVLTSWKSNDDPSPGDYVHGFETRELPQSVVVMGSSKKKYRSGPWNGITFNSLAVDHPTIGWNSIIVHNETALYFEFDSYVDSIVTIVQLDVTGLVQRMSRVNESTGWDARYTTMDDPCNDYGQCGPNGLCRMNKYPRCECLQGYVPKFIKQWQRLNLSGGCVRKVRSHCSVEGDGFLKVFNSKLPDLIDFWLDKNINLEECQRRCLKNCSCTAYANPDVRNGGSGCLMWFGDLIDVIEFREDEYEQILYLRLPASELDSFKGSAAKKRKVILSTILTFLGLIMLGVVLLVTKQAKNRKRGFKLVRDDADLTLLDFGTVVNATRNFSEMNLIGRGGFGSVYKGYLLCGREVAVKRLSESSGQGIEEFMNEAVLIARLQHRNLVGLLGCCIEGQERILIYEYMPNMSLDHFIFDHTMSNPLTWEKRFDIIVGIARGLLYLHQDSKLQVIHRDIKTSNILLDADMNPKISDFGLARIVGGSDKEARTRRIIGTYGYMSPEYAFKGRFSVKSDVFSFGVLLLEVVSGQRNREFGHPDHYHHLLGHAWLLWREGRVLELMHEGPVWKRAQATACNSMHKPEMPQDSILGSQVNRCVHVGLLCVQKHPEDRPSMASVVFMLANEETSLPEPKQPGFFIERSLETTQDRTSTGKLSPQAEGVLTMTMPQGR